MSDLRTSGHGTSSAGGAPSERAISLINQLIASEGILPGDRVPTVRDIARKLGIDKGTVQRAYRQLEAHGAVRRRGNGPRARLVVADTIRPSSTSAGRVAVLSSHTTEMARHHGAEAGREVAQLQGVLEVLRATSHEPLVVSPDLFFANGRRWLSEGLAGVIVLRQLPARSDAILHDFSARVPVISDRAWTESGWCHRVAHDHAAGTAALVDLLVAQGRRRILPVGFPHDRQPWMEQRLVGYRTACARAGLSSLEPLAYGLSKPIEDEAGFRSRVRSMAGHLIEYLAGPQAVDAMIVAHDSLVPVVAEAAALAGRAVHADLAICGYDNAWAWIGERAWSRYVPFATIDKDNHALGRRQAEWLVAELHKVRQPGPPSASTSEGPQELLVPFHLLRL